MPHRQIRLRHPRPARRLRAPCQPSRRHKGGRAPPPPPPASSVQSVPPEMAEAILGREVTDLQGKDLGRLIDVLVDETGLPRPR